MLVTHSNVYNFCFITKIVESKSRTRLTGSWENARSDIFSVLDALNASYATRKYSLFRFLSTKFNFHGGHRRPKILTKNNPGDFRTFCAQRDWSISLYYFILVTHSNLHNFCYHLDSWVKIPYTAHLVVEKMHEVTLLNVLSACSIFSRNMELFEKQVESFLGVQTAGKLNK